MEKDEEEASKCYFRNSFCLFMSVYVRFLRRRRMWIGRRRTEKELYMRELSRLRKRRTEEEGEEVEGDCQEKD